MKQFKFLGTIIACFFTFMICTAESCDGRKDNTSALDEQDRTEVNQRRLNETQPAPQLTWSLERDNIIKRFKLMNDRSTVFYMYLFIEGVGEPVGYYIVNKVSSVNSQLTNTDQIVHRNNTSHVLPSPAEDGSYGTNGDGVFGFTPEGNYIEHNMKYVVSIMPLNFTKPVTNLAIFNVSEQQQLEAILKKAGVK
jgi:hypothetical protein